MACPLPEYIANCPPQATYSMGGVQYSTWLLCDDDGQPVFVVAEICDGVPSGVVNVYDLTWTLIEAPELPLRNCLSGGSGGNAEEFVFCDSGNADHPFVSRFVVDPDGVVVAALTGTFELDQTTPYVVVGPAVVCGGEIIDTELVGPLCELDGDGEVVGYAWQRIQYDGSVQISTQLTGIKLAAPTTWVAPYVLGGGNTLSTCPSDTCINSVTSEQRCQYVIATGLPTGNPVTVVTVYDCDGVELSQVITNYDGTPYVVDPLVLLRPCSDTLSFAPVVLCDDNGPFLRHISYTPVDGPVSAVNTLIDGTTPYVTVGTVHVCPSESPVFQGEFILCDGNGPFLRKYIQDETGEMIGVLDLNYEDGSPYVPDGDVRLCAPSDFEQELLCDDDGAGNVTAFLRTYSRDQVGNVLIEDTELDGTTAYAFTGTVGRCLASGAAAPSSRTIHREVLSGIDLWTAPAGLRSVTIVVITRTTLIQVTTVDGASQMFSGESATWSVSDDDDADLNGGVFTVSTGTSDIAVINWLT